MHLKTFLTLLTITSVCNAENIPDIDYPAPPGPYPTADIIKNSKLNLGEGSPYVYIEPDNNESPNNTNNGIVIHETTQQSLGINVQPAPERVTTAPVLPEPLNNRQPSTNHLTMAPPARPATPVLQPAPQPQAAMQPMMQAPANKNAWPDRATYSDREITPYPDALVLQRQYRNAGELPFSDWGDMPMPQNSETAGYPRDYGAETFMRDNIQIPHHLFENPYPVSSHMNNWAASNRSGLNGYDRNRLRSYPMPPLPNQDFGHYQGRNNFQLQPPVDPYLSPFNDFPVPQNIYGMDTGKAPATRAGSGYNDQFFRRIPEEEIIYPPSYPGKRY